MLERSECGSGGCVTCPFSFNEDAEYINNSGCLPSQYEILELPKKQKVNWGCHGEVDIVCGGFAKEFTRLTGKPIDKTLPIVNFDEYTYLGMDVAIALAKVRKGLNPLKDSIEDMILLRDDLNIHYFDYKENKR